MGSNVYSSILPFDSFSQNITCGYGDKELVDGIDVEYRWKTWLVFIDDVMVKAEPACARVALSTAVPRLKAEVLVGLSGQLSLLQ